MIVGYRFDRGGHSFEIRLQPSGRWLAIVDHDGLGSYHRAEAALDDLLGGHAGGDIDSSEFDLPETLREWQVIIR